MTLNNVLTLRTINTHTKSKVVTGYHKCSYNVVQDYNKVVYNNQVITAL